jgi:site-specific recombinase XerD
MLLHKARGFCCLLGLKKISINQRKLVLLIVLYYLCLNNNSPQKPMRVTASLKTPKLPESLIVFTISDSGGVNIKAPTGIRIPTRHWSRRQGKVLPSNRDAAALNKALEAQKSLNTEIYLEFKSKGIIPTTKQISDAKKGKLKTEQAPQTFWGLFDTFFCEKIQRQSTSYQKKYNTLKLHLQAFEEREGALSIEAINKQTLGRLQVFFCDAQGLNNQTTAKYLTLVKTFLLWCLERGHVQSTNFRFFRVAKQPDTLRVALSNDDLEAIRRCNIEGKGYLENVRKLFLLSCLVGLRFSDYIRITASHLQRNSKGEPFLNIRQEKTSEHVQIPLTAESYQLVEALIRGEIRPISNQKMNEYVKELCQLAGLTKPFEVHTFRGNTKHTEQRPMYELISSHTGRRTFATSLLQKGLPSEIVMQFTGHRDYKSFQKYVNIPKEAAFDAVRKALQW